MTHVYQPHAGGFAYFTSGVINGAIGVGGTWTAYSTLTLPAYTLGGTVTSNGQSFSGTIANLGTVTTVDLNGGTIDGTIIGGAVPAAGTFTTAAATTGNITTVNATTVDATNIEVTNLKAKDGTAAGSIADATGVVTLASSVLTTTDINAGTIDGTTQASGTINGPIAAGGTWTAAAAWTLPAFTLGGTVTSNGQSFSGTIANLGTVTTADINGGTIDGTVIGGASAAAATFTDLTTTGNTTLTSVSSLNMAGTLDLDGNPLAIDADADTYLYETADDVIRLVVGGSDHTIWNTTGLGLGVVPSFAFHLQNATAVAVIDSAAGGANLSLRRANTSYASPSALADNDLIGVLAWRGHDGSAYSVAQARISGFASGAWTGSSRGTYITFDLTPSGSTTQATKFTFSAAGTMYAGDGAASFPTYSFSSSGNSDCGLFLSSNKPAISTNGTQVCLFDTDKLTLAAGYHVTSATATGTTPAIQSGTYTPTGTGVSNVNTVDIIERQAQWLRVGNVVTVSGELSVSPSAAGVVVLRLSLPIASALTTAYQLSGSGAWHFTSGNVTAVGIQGDAANNEAKFTFGSGVNSQQILTYTYSYEVLA